MKRLVLLIVLLVTFAASSSFAQATRRVLVEEFTNTGCPPCAATDPMVEDFEFSQLDKIAAIKWHTSWPDNTDPFYKAQTPLSLSDTRGVKLYGVQGVPFISMDGAPVNNAGNFGVSDKQSFIDYVSQRMTTPTPYQIDIVQSMTTDSIIADITIKCLGAPIGTNLALGVVFTERYNPFHGNNGRPFYTSIVRNIPSGLAADGNVAVKAGFPAFTIQNGQTETFHYAAKIGTTWTKNQLMSVAFIQDVDTKEVYNANWTLPGVKVEAPTGALLIPADAPLTYKVINTTETPVTLKGYYSATGVPADWSVATTGIAADSTLVIPANSSSSVSLNSTAASNKNGAKPFSITFTQPSGLYIGAAEGYLWGKDNQNVIVDAGAGTAKCNSVSTAITSARPEYLNKNVVVTSAVFESLFPSWSSFHTVMYISGTAVGLYSDVGTWEKITPYLAGGGHFMLSSTVAVAAYFGSGDDKLFQLWRDNFHIEPSGDFDQSTPWVNLTGISGDPIGNGVNTTVSSMTTTQPLTASDAAGIPSFQDENGNNVSMRSVNETNGKSLMLTFGIENIKTADRNAVAKRIMDWFDGTASVKTSSEASEVKVTNYPNPVTKSTKFDYSLTERGLVSLAIFDVMGRQISTLVSNEMQDQGTYTADFDASHLSNGSYTYVLTTGSKKVVGTMTVTK